ncbi:LysE family translocator [Tropicibacter oceani]|uniref:LysE family translocator n=1 Tax=Tropicibacter oceani TaxID=3058420 RepID=A0ABY8QJM9_9RHOB|nr:LysE family translocator [Tropicibacter oceani]WGW04814.1 LysE family translocator [Tropicibacter oceani]
MSVDLIVLLAFVPAGLALNLTPGADMMFCLAQGLRGGARPGWAASAGIAAGGLVHAALAGLGLSALLATFPAAFEAIRWGGVAYLLWLAVKTLRAPIGGPQGKGLRPAQAFVQGFAVNMTNPKVILFILAFVPQFVTPDRAILPQFLIFGMVLSLGGLVINGLVGQFAGYLRAGLTGGSVADRVLRWLSATLFAGLAVRLALTSTR